MRNEQQPLPISWSHSEKLALLWTTVFGADGQNGLRGDMRETKARVSDMEHWKAQVIAIATTTRWLALGLISLGGFLLSDSAAKILRTIVQSLAP